MHKNNSRNLSPTPSTDSLPLLLAVCMTGERQAMQAMLRRCFQTTGRELNSRSSLSPWSKRTCRRQGPTLATGEEQAEASGEVSPSRQGRPRTICFQLTAAMISPGAPFTCRGCRQHGLFSRLTTALLETQNAWDGAPVRSWTLLQPGQQADVQVTPR